MTQFESYYQQQLKQLDFIIEKTTKYLATAPPGSLHVQRSHNTIQYMWRNTTPTINEQYIKRSEILLAQQLAQKDYAKKLLTFAEKKRRELLVLNQQYNWDEIAQFHKQLSPERQALITPFILSDSEYSILWLQKNNHLAAANPNKYLLDPDNGFHTENHELVRSKSEKILADKFFMMDIPYIYEKPLSLSNKQKFYPDFTLLNKRTRQEFYWEHLGLMDDPVYCENALKKISTYQNNGFFLGKNLLITYEGYSLHLDIKSVESLIAEFLL